MGGLGFLEEGHELMVHGFDLCGNVNSGFVELFDLAIYCGFGLVWCLLDDYSGADVDIEFV